MPKKREYKKPALKVVDMLNAQMVSTCCRSGSGCSAPTRKAKSKNSTTSNIS